MNLDSLTDEQLMSVAQDSLFSWAMECGEEHYERLCSQGNALSAPLDSRVRLGFAIRNAVAAAHQ